MCNNQNTDYNYLSVNNNKCYCFRDIPSGNFVLYLGFKSGSLCADGTYASIQ